MVIVQGILIKVSPFIVRILYIPKICVILCVYVQSVMENTHQGIYEKMVKKCFRYSEWRRLHVKNLIIFICFYTLMW